MNIVILMGNLTREPELRYTTSGKAVCAFGLAINERWMKDGEKQERVDFFDIECWGRVAENTAQYMSKGSGVAIQGKLVQDRWQNKAGENRSRVKVNALKVVFLPRGQKKDESRGARTPDDNDRDRRGAGPEFDMPDEEVPF